MAQQRTTDKSSVRTHGYTAVDYPFVLLKLADLCTLSVIRERIINLRASICFEHACSCSAFLSYIRADPCYHNTTASNDYFNPATRDANGSSFVRTI